jgi:short subunit dehydrogenase-like uncharacterized protein
MITIVGATGFTGTLIAKQLEQDEVSMRLVARNARKLETLKTSLQRECETAIADVADLNQLKTAIEGSRVVINAAGPFTTLGLKVAEECIKGGVHYLDITGEQQFIREVIERFSASASKNKVTVIPSCAFEYALADEAARFLEKEMGGLESFESTYVINGMFTSRGTKRSVLCALESESHQLRNGKTQRISAGAVAAFQHPDGKTYQRFPFPAGEVYLIPLHSQVRNISTFLTSEAPPAVLQLLSTTMPVAARSPFFKNILNFIIDLGPETPQNTNETTFSVYCEGEFKRKRMGLNIAGRDPYSLTAVIAARVAQKLLKDTTVRRGVISPSMVDKLNGIMAITQAESTVWQSVEIKTVV